MTDQETVAALIRERDAALESLDETRIRAWARRALMQLPDNPASFWAGVHMARAQLRSLPPHERARSTAWLRAQGWERCPATRERPLGWRLRKES